MSTISLITDFGNKDWYVGVMKGVMYDVYPAARMVDLTHEIQNHSIEQAAFVLASSYSYFSYGSIHVVIVDPGVGGTRAPILLESRGHYFIGPDNGVFCLVDHPSSALYQLDRKEYRLPVVSETFHGRDIFAPAAAYLARGVPADQLGTRLARRIVTVDIAKPEKSADGSLRARVVHVDRFGNCVTNIPRGLISPALGTAPVEIGLTDHDELIPGALAATYGEAGNGHPIVIAGSSGFLEISLNKAPFADRYKVRRGDNVTLHFPQK